MRTGASCYTLFSQALNTQLPHAIAESSIYHVLLMLLMIGGVLARNNEIAC